MLLKVTQADRAFWSSVEQHLEVYTPETGGLIRYIIYVSFKRGT